MDLLAQSLSGVGVAASPWSNVPVQEHLFLFSPLIVLTVTMLGVVACPLILGRGVRTIGTVAVVGVAVAFFLSVRVAAHLSGEGTSGLSTEAAAGMLLADNLSVGFQIILLLFLAGVMCLWWVGSAATERNAPEFFILLIGGALGMALMASTANLLMIVVAIETASLPSYALVGFDKSSRRGAEASLKYMVFGAVCAAVMLYGASLLYGLTGSLSVGDVAEYTVSHLGAPGGNLVLYTGLFCMLVGIAFKISAVPFHFWCPDAFEGAKIEVTTWLSVASKAAGLVLLARLTAVFCSAVDRPIEMSFLSPLAWSLGILASITCTVGNLAAFKQRSVTRLLAYSSIAHAGYMLMAAAVFLHPSRSNATAGIAALGVYIVVYLFMNLGAFGVTALVSWETGSDEITEFTGLIRRAPWLAVPMVICLVSLVGLPPLAGFIAKWWVLLALGEMHSALGWLLIIVASVNTLISLYYYMRVVVQMTLRDGAGSKLSSPLRGIALVNICAALLILLTFFAAPLKRTATRFSRGLVPAAALTERPDGDSTVRLSAVPSETVP